ncbi:hypothetical protein BGZ60DRAFT_534571 [Tricladium varicosporioides]|nr:hypothetical protein BGZ60DRAFT_534571 [Hymenoscyphus varicosporioides]
MEADSKPTPNFQSTFKYVNNAQCQAIGIALPAVCILIVALRFWTRRKQKARTDFDDWLILAGLLWVCAMGVCFIIGASERVMGYPKKPDPDLPDEELEHYISPEYLLLEKLQFPFQIFLILAYGCIKASIVAFYRRLFVVTKRSPFDYITFLTQTVIGLWTITFLLLVIFPCGRHLWANWGSTADQFKFCPIGFTSEYGLAISDLIVDVFVFLLPIPLIWQLRLSIQKKIAVSGILLLGGAAVGASIARMVLYIEILNAITGSDPIIIDENQVLTVALWWSLLECGLALIAACLPTLSYLFTHFDVKARVASVRSIFSLRSAQSGTGFRSTEEEGGQIVPCDAPYTTIQYEGSMASNIKVVEEETRKGIENGNMNGTAREDIELGER